MSRFRIKTDVRDLRAEILLNIRVAKIHLLRVLLVVLVIYLLPTTTQTIHQNAPSLSSTTFLCVLRWPNRSCKHFKCLSLLNKLVDGSSSDDGAVVLDGTLWVAISPIRS
jgi:hypothetical protein